MSRNLFAPLLTHHPDFSRFPKACVNEVDSEHTKAKLYKAKFNQASAPVTQDYKS